MNAKWVEALKTNHLNIDCIEMQLVQNKENNPITYTGKGYIQQDEHGNLYFKIYADKHSDLITLSEKLFENTAGKIYQHEDYYSLSACDYYGHIWKAENIIPEYMSAPKGVYAYGAIATLRVQNKIPKQLENRSHSLTIHFFEEIEFPCNHRTKTLTEIGTENTFRQISLDVAEFSVFDCRFLIRKLDKEVTISAVSDAAMIANFDIKIIEALQFVFARSLQWRAIIKCTDKEDIIRFSSFPLQSSKTHLHQPLDEGVLAESFWILFSNYLEYIIRSTKDEGWHICSAHLYNASEASSNSMEAWAIGISIAVEGIASLITAPNNDEREQGNKSVNDLFACIEKWLTRKTEQKKLIDRIKGFRGQLNKVSVKDRLYSLIEIGAIEPSHVSAWSTLRNKHVHPHGPTSYDSQEIQRLLNLINQVTVLMYHIVFHLIGYKGTYNDYSTIGYPKKTYPLLKE